MRSGEGIFGTDWDFKSNGGQGFGRDASGASTFDPFGRAGMGYEQAVPKESFDIKADLNVSFEEAFHGTKKNFSVRIPGKPKADSISLKIPEGCSEGAKLRLKGQGKPNPMGGNGDLICEIHIEPHRFFQLVGKNVEVKVPVTACEAALGDKVEVPTPDGKKLRIKVPAGTQSGTKLTVKGKGAKKRGGGFGDLIVKIEVVVPKKLTKEQEKKLKAYSEVEDKGVRPW